MKRLMPTSIALMLLIGCLASAQQQNKGPSAVITVDTSAPSKPYSRLIFGGLNRSATAASATPCTGTGTKRGPSIA